MASFVWEARTKSGELRNGTMTADSAELVSQRLRAQALSPQDVRKAPTQISFKLPSFGTGIKGKDLVIFTRQFSTMIDAGLPLVQCLDILGSQSGNPALKKVIIDLKSTVETGTTYADALKKHPKVFDHLYVNLIAAGEAGGIMDTILNRLATYIEKNMKLVKQVKGALSYPIIILSVAFIVVGVMLIWVIPTFEKMFRDFNAPLPGLTQAIIDISRNAQHWAIPVVATIGAAIFGFVRFRATKRGTEIVDKYILKMPIIGQVVRKVAVAKFTRTMGTMLSSGVPILDSLDIVAKAAGNDAIEKGIMFVRAKISEGKTMAQPLADIGVFPPMVVQMIAVGEATGALDKMLEKIADFYEDEVDVAVESMTAMIEPLMMVFLGGVLGTILIAMYLPIFTLAAAIK